MTNRQERIWLLEEQACEAKLLSVLACDQDTRTRNAKLADDLRSFAHDLRISDRANAA